MILPIHCLQSYSNGSDNPDEWFLVGASGSRLIVQSSSGAGSVWPIQEENTSENETDNPDDERPGKRVKLSPPDSSNKANFLCLALSHDRNYIVAVTGEDKCIRVFKIDSQCQLHQLSQRCMARRPSSVTLTFDDSLILCADKFGDVYSLPLLPPLEETIEVPEAAPVGPIAPNQEEYRPAASVLTVHSGRNRKVLEEQMKYASKGQKKSKETLKFQHELLLGHVSMLTDIAYANVKGRTYIITSDRDEHIRISRGPPQAHIIEGFCSGHEEFVNSLCMTSSGLLISGGGDSSLFVWDWVNYKLLTKIGIRDPALRYLKSNPGLASIVPLDEESFKVAVSGIWSIPSIQGEGNKVLVACEGIPALFQLDIENPDNHDQIIALNGNPLDVTVLQSKQEPTVAIVAVDNVHESGSTSKFRDDNDVLTLQSFSYDGVQWSVDEQFGTILKSFTKRLVNHLTNAAPNAEVAKESIRDILYGVENLRKRPGLVTDTD